MQLVKLKCINEFYSLSITDWLVLNLALMNRFASHDFEWNVLFVVLCWKLWSYPNHVMFDENFVVKEEIIDVSKRFFQELIDARLRPILQVVPIATDLIVTIMWKALRQAWLKPNVDGVVRPLDDVAVVGGVIRYDHGGWLYEFAQSLGKCSV
ncbi:hypothetical protein V6N13_110505 [Hibiscus sabdariffa]